MRRGTVLLLGAALACAKAEPPPPPPPAPPALDTAAVTQAAADFRARFAAAEKSGTADSVFALYTDDVRLDVQGMPPIVGRAALDAVIRPMYGTRRITDMQLLPNETAVVSNDLVLQGGTFAETYVEKKKTMVEHGRYASSIVKGNDGQWRFGYLMAIIDSTVAGR
jgi:uncharacterized protein (TIGR02246 family)